MKPIILLAEQAKRELKKKELGLKAPKPKAKTGPKPKKVPKPKGPKPQTFWNKSEAKKRRIVEDDDSGEDEYCPGVILGGGDHV